jgi:hypothetical protein
LNSSELARRHCVPCEGGTPPMAQEQAEEYMENIPGWAMIDGHIARANSNSTSTSKAWNSRMPSGRRRRRRITIQTC